MFFVRNGYSSDIFRENRTYPTNCVVVPVWTFLLSSAVCNPIFRMSGHRRNRPSFSTCSLLTRRCFSARSVCSWSTSFWADSGLDSKSFSADGISTLVDAARRFLKSKIQSSCRWSTISYARCHGTSHSKSLLPDTFAFTPSGREGAEFGKTGTGYVSSCLYQVWCFIFRVW